VRVYDSTTRREVRRLVGEHNYQTTLKVGFSTGGDRLVAARYGGAGGYGGPVRVWQVGAWKRMHGSRLEADPPPRSTWLVAPDLKTMIAWQYGPGPGGGDLRVCDVTTGRQLRNLPDPSGIGRFSLAFSPDGRLLAIRQVAFRPMETPTCVFDLATGAEVCRFGGSRATTGVHFAPDGRSVGESDSQGGFRLWEASTGRQRCRITPDGGQAAFSFSPDGTLLATWPGGGPAQEPTGSPPLIWELGTGTLIGRLAGHRGKVLDVAFSPDGKLVASASADSTMLLWELGAVAGGRARRRAPLAERDLDRLWADLAGEDAARAYAAMFVLRGTAAQAVSCMERRLQPVRGKIAPDRVDRWLAELDSDDFATRERATRELGRHAELVAPRLRQALEVAPSPEARARLERILAKAEKVQWEPGALRALRAIEVLEQIGTSEARAVLQAMANGEPAARLTEEAKASLGRLARRP
jgi:hypothetical protein